MKTYRSERRTIVESILESVTCGICNKVFDDDWNTGNYEIAETNISISTGDCYPEGGCREELHVDVCPKCFMKEVVPLIEKLGAKFEKEEIDF